MIACVTGATGFIGHNLVTTLLQDGWRVIALHRKSSAIDRLANYEVELREVNLYDYNSVLGVIPYRADAIFHVAANTAHWPCPNQWRDNVLATRNLVQVALNKEVKRFVFTSTGATGGAVHDTTEGITSRYIKTKKEAELEVDCGIKKGLDGVIVKPIIVIGPHDHSGYSQIFKWKNLQNALPGSLEFCHVQDIVAGHLQAFYQGRCCERYYLGGEYRSWFEVFSIIAKLTGAKAPRRTLSRWMLYAYAYPQLWRYYLRGKKPTLSPDIVRLLRRDGRVPYHEQYKTERELGYRVSGVEKACRDCWEWLQNGHA